MFPHKDIVKLISTYGEIYMSYLYKRKDGHWYYKYKYLDSNGYSKYKCKSCKTKDEQTARLIQNKYDRIYGMLGTNPLVSENYSMEESTIDYLQHREKLVKRGALSPNTYHGDEISLNSFLNWTRKKSNRLYMLEDLNQKDFQKFIDTRLDEVSPTTISREVRHFSSFLSWLVKKNLYKTNFVIGKKLDKPKPKKRVDVPSKDEWMRLWNFVEHKIMNRDEEYDFFYHLVWVQMNLGLRIGEAIQIKWVEGKDDHSTGHSRSYCFLNNAHTELTIYFKRRLRKIPTGGLKDVFNRIPKKGRGKKFREADMEYVFGNSYTNNLRGQSSISRDYKKLFKEVGIPQRYTSHSLRHGWAVNQIRLGTDIYKISKFMGHSVVQITELYADHLNTEDFNEIVTNNKPA